MSERALFKLMYAVFILAFAFLFIDGALYAYALMLAGHPWKGLSAAALATMCGGLFSLAIDRYRYWRGQ